VIYRRNVMMIAGALASIGGLILALNSESVIATKYDRLSDTFYPWVMVVVGGAANNLGTTLGAIMFILILRIIDLYKYSLMPFIPFDPVWLSPILLSIALGLSLFFRPDGLIREKPTKTLSEAEVIRLVNEIKNNKSTLYALGFNFNKIKVLKRTKIF